MKDLEARRLIYQGLEDIKRDHGLQRISFAQVPPGHSGCAEYVNVNVAEELNKINNRIDVLLNYLEVKEEEIFIPVVSKSEKGIKIVKQTGYGNKEETKNV